MTTLQVTDYERVWVEGLNRGDVSAADEAFAPDCVVVVERWEQWDQSLMLQQLGLQ